MRFCDHWYCLIASLLNLVCHKEGWLLLTVSQSGLVGSLLPGNEKRDTPNCLKNAKTAMKSDEQMPAVLPAALLDLSEGKKALLAITGRLSVSCSETRCLEPRLLIGGLSVNELLGVFLV